MATNTAKPPYKGALPPSSKESDLPLTLNPNRLNTLVKSATALKYAQPQAQIRKEVGISQLQQRHIKGWYGNYINTLRNNANSSQRYENRQSRAEQQNVNRGYGQERAANSSILNQLSTDAARRGATANPNDAAILQGATANRRMILQGQVNEGREHAAIRNTDMRARIGEGKSSKVAAALAEHQHRADLGTAMRNLKQQMGDFAVLFRSQTLTDYQKSKLAEKIAEANIALNGSKLGISQQLANETIRSNKANEKISALAAKNANPTTIQTTKKKHGVQTVITKTKP